MTELFKGPDPVKRDVSQLKPCYACDSFNSKTKLCIKKGGRTELVRAYDDNCWKQKEG